MTNIDGFYLLYQTQMLLQLVQELVMRITQLTLELLMHRLDLRVEGHQFSSFYLKLFFISLFFIIYAYIEYDV